MSGGGLSRMSVSDTERQTTVKASEVEVFDSSPRKSDDESSQRASPSAGFALGTFDADGATTTPSQQNRKARSVTPGKRTGRRRRSLEAGLSTNGRNQSDNPLYVADQNGEVAGAGFLKSDTFEDDSDDNGEQPRSATLQRRIFVLFDEPDSSIPAAILAAIIMLMIMASTVSFCAETTPWAKERPWVMDLMYRTEVVCIISFTVEYLIRVACCTHRMSPNPSVLKYLIKPMNLIDFFAIAPFYIELLLGGHLRTEVLRALRMTRVFRVLKVGGIAECLMLFVDGMSRAREGLVLLLFLMMLYLCVFAALLHMLEFDAQQDCAKCAADGFGCSCPSVVGFTSIPTTWYFILATITTVGYGDMYPITLKGKLMCGAMMICGIFVLGLPIVVIGRAFDDSFKDAARWQAEKAVARQAKRKAAGGVDPIQRAPPVPLHKLLHVESQNPDISVLACIRQCEVLLDGLYGKTGDRRFYHARDTLIHGLDDDLLSVDVGLL